MEGKQGVCLCPLGCRALLIAASVFKKKKERKEEEEKLRRSRPDCHSVFVIYVFKREKNVAVAVNDSEKEGK